MTRTMLMNGKFATLDPTKPQATAVAIKDGLFEAVGSDEDIMWLADASTRVINLEKRTVIPGLNDSHTHVIRGGLHYNMELRWEGVPSVVDALRGSAWFSGERDVKGAIAVGQYADLAVLSADYFSIPAEDIKDLTSVLTMVDGDIVHGTGSFSKLAPSLPPASPDWSPVRLYGSHYQANASSGLAAMVNHQCLVHGHHPHHAHQSVVARTPKDPFWGILGCSCFAFCEATIHGSNKCDARWLLLRAARP